MKFKMDFKKSRIMYSLQDISPKKKTMNLMNIPHFSFIELWKSSKYLLLAKVVSTLISHVSGEALCEYNVH